jgi:Helicase conserved C-terminal domain
LNKIGKISSFTSSTRGQSLQFTGTPLHELLSKYLSPTYDDGREALAMESDSASVTVGSSNINNNNNNNSANTVRPILQSRTTIFCSATIPQHRYFAKQCVQNQWMLHTPKYISLRTGSQHLPSQLKHTYTITSEPGKKLATLRRILKKMIMTCRETNIPNRVVVFSDHHRPFEEIAKVIAKDLNGFYYNERTASSILSSLSSSSSTTTITPLPATQHQALISVLRYEDSLSQRAIAMDALRGDTSNYRYNSGKRLTSESTETEEEEEDDDDDNNNDVNETSLSTSSTPTTLFRVLLSTDLAARGLDIVDITHIIHMDLPDNADIYVHRSGRTGRLNRSGHVISIITQEQEFVLQRIMNQLQVDITCIGRPTTAISNTNEQ